MRSPVAVTIVARERAELQAVDAPGALGPRDVRGTTVASLVSPGTELSWNYDGIQPDPSRAFPNCPGYSAVFRVDETGQEVKGVRPGDLLFCMGGHRSVQQCAAAEAVTVPEGVPAREAVVARLMGVTMTTLMTTAARPGDIVLVTGAGPVGYLGAHLFAASGYDVWVVDPSAARRETVAQSGIRGAYASAAEATDELRGKVALVLECSGNEQAVLDGVGLVRKGGEVVLVGVPWQRRTERSAFELLHAVFHRYAILRSGWEWEAPLHGSDFRPHGIFEGFRLALRWMAEGRIPLGGATRLHDPSDPQAVYQALLRGTAEGLFQVFDWERWQRA